MPAPKPVEPETPAESRRWWALFACIHLPRGSKGRRAAEQKFVELSAGEKPARRRKKPH